MSTGSPGSSHAPGAPGTPPAEASEHLTGIFVGIVLLEAAIIVALYWIGRHFAV